MEKVRKLSERKFLIVFFTVLLAGALFISFFIVQYREKNKRSPLHQIIYEMDREANNWVTPKSIPFPAQSPETLFLEGLQLFGQADYVGAKKIFEEVLTKKGKDPALRGYTLFFLNESNYILTGVGDRQMVERTMEALTHYKPFVYEKLWTCVLTLAYQEQDQMAAIKMLEDYLRIHNNLLIEEWAAIKNSIAMMEYLSGNYSQSIMDFYDVILRAEAVNMSPRLRDEYIYSREYIANIYYLFEDYEGAIELYSSLIEEGKKNKDMRLINHYINLSSSYMKIGEIAKAKAAIKELEYLSPDMDLGMRDEIKGSVLEVLAGISMVENNYKKAGEYLEEALLLYEKSEGRVFFGGWHFVELTYCKYLLHEGNYNEVISRLEQMRQQENDKLYGIEREVSEILLKAYEETGNKEKQLQVYGYQLETEMKMESVIKKEYLNFSKFYRDANRLQNTNVKLTKSHSVSFLVICFAIIAYMLIFYVIHLVREREITDPLTGVFNHKKLASISKKLEKTGTPQNMGLVLTEIDGYKEYKEAYGSLSGRQMLKDTAEILVSSVGSRDEIIHYREAVFLLILSDVSKEDMVTICERVKKRMKEADREYPFSVIKPYVSLSMGVCFQKEMAENSLQKMIEKTEAILEKARRAGGDCFVIEEA